MIKKGIKAITNLLSVCIIVCAVFILLSVLFTESGKAPSLFGNSVFHVMTSSMEPTIPLDSIIVARETDPASLQVGDIISFYSKDPALDGTVNTHRIVAIEKDGEHYSFTTRGDANNIDDHYNVTEQELIGKVIFTSYQLGRVVSLLSNPLVFVPIILIPLAIILAMNLYQTVSLAKKIAKEEEEAAVREAVEAIRKKKATEKK
jgi:signal peptidase I